MMTGWGVEQLSASQAENIDSPCKTHTGGPADRMFDSIMCYHNNNIYSHRPSPKWNAAVIHIPVACLLEQVNFYHIASPCVNKPFYYSVAQDQLT